MRSAGEGREVKGKIDLHGQLHIERAGVMTGQECPYRSDEAFCSDSCPLLGEPEHHEDWINESDGKKKMASIMDDEGHYEWDGRKWELELCKTTLYFTDFTDERVEK